MVEGVAAAWITKLSVWVALEEAAAWSFGYEGFGSSSCDFGSLLADARIVAGVSCSILLLLIATVV